MTQLDDDHERFPPTGDRYALQERYLELTRDRLPRAAEQNGWRVQNDHCFMRIALDHACCGCWYDHLDRRLRAYKQLTTAQLEVAVACAERMLAEGEPAVEELNRQSLAWRGKWIAESVSRRDASPASPPSASSD
ncbi:MAG: hypothetical protein AAGJ46_02785 [Planctomycetota bacterium]